MTFNIWEGIYQSFSDCSATGPGHEGTTWADRSLVRIEELFHISAEQKPFPFTPADYYLPLLIASLPAGSASILDFGGGLGFTYVPVKANCTNRRIDYHIVDSISICSKGTSLFKDDSQIHFHSELPPVETTMDIVHLGSSLQYIEDWKGLLCRLAEYKPRYILLTDLMAGDIPTYASIQNYYESKMPTWFFNIDEVLQVFSELSFTLQMRSMHNNKYLGVRQEIPQDNFPEEYRLKKSCNLLFSDSQND